MKKKGIEARKREGKWPQQAWQGPVLACGVAGAVARLPTGGLPLSAAAHMHDDLTISI
jgi:hypothetical protein